MLGCAKELRTWICPIPGYYAQRYTALHEWSWSWGGILFATLTCLTLQALFLYFQFYLTFNVFGICRIPDILWGIVIPAKWIKTPFDPVVSRIWEFMLLFAPIWRSWTCLSTSLACTACELLTLPGDKRPVEELQSCTCRMPCIMPYILKVCSAALMRLSYTIHVAQ